MPTAISHNTIVDPLILVFFFFFVFVGLFNGDEGLAFVSSAPSLCAFFFLLPICGPPKFVYFSCRDFGQIIFIHNDRFG